MSKVAKVYATDPGSKMRLLINGSAIRLSHKVGTIVPDDVAQQLEREIAGDPGCATLPEPCAECLRHCAEHEVLRVEWNEKNPDQASLPHFGHVCAEDAHRGHVGVPGRTDIRVEREEPLPAVTGTTSVKASGLAVIHEGEVIVPKPAADAVRGAQAKE